MKKIFLFLLLILTGSAIYCQSLSVYGIDASNFPKMKAKVFAMDENGSQITNLSDYKIVLTEDSVQRTDVKITCPPPKPIQPISAVLTVDVSGSMGGRSLDILKAAATTWLKLMPLGTSECAITGFRSDNYFISDFSHDRGELINSIQNLNCDDGTDFNAAFINRTAGALLVAEKGKYKKVVVIFTDGFADGNKEEIIKKANEINTTVYCVTVDNPTPELLRDIATKTGGQYFDNVTTETQAEDIYKNILMIAQGGDPCEIEWMSGGCPENRKANLKIKQPSEGLKPSEGLTNEFSYNILYDKLPQLKFSPSASIKFGIKEPGKTFMDSISITAQVESVYIKSITGNNPKINIIDYGGTNPPFTINPGESRKLIIEYKPDDSSYTFSRFEIEGNACYGKYFYASGGDFKKKSLAQNIKLIFPNGGEELIAGSDTSITWEGVAPSDYVKLEYTIDAGTTWKNITDTASGLSYKWQVPFIPSTRVLVRATATVKYGIFEVEGMVLIPAGTFKMGNTGAYPGSWANDEKPVHEVTITKPFLLGKYEVTQKQYEVVMGKNSSYFKGENLPVEEVSWYDAVEFCNKLSEMQGLEPCYHGSGTNITCNFDANGYRLPTEAEWEYACKAGTKTDFYSGDLRKEYCEFDPYLEKIGWYCGNSGNKTHECGQKEPNLFGLFDMSGNVWEWCWDWFDSKYYSNNAVTDPKGASSGMYRVLRGGSWYYYSKSCRSSSRNSSYPEGRSLDRGFRISRTY